MSRFNSKNFSFTCIHVIMIVSGHVTLYDSIAHLPGDWVKLDDDKVSVVTEEQILKLSGGGDWQSGTWRTSSSMPLGGWRD